MKTWVIGGTLIAIVSIGIFFAFPKRNPPAAEVRVEFTPPPAVADPPAPVAVAALVDVTDIDPLLDPPAVPASEPTGHTGPELTAVGYEEPAPRGAQPAAVVRPIPPADESEPPPVEIAPMPRAVGLHGRLPESICKIEFRSAPGLLMLDQETAASLPDADLSPDPDLTDTFLPSGNYGLSRTLSPSQTVRICAKKTPLAPLYCLADADLMRQNAEGAVPAAEVASSPSSFWIPAPEKPDPLVALVRGVYAVLYTPGQAPASRTEWYTRWYGSTRIPELNVPPSVSKDSDRELFSFYVGLFGGN